eukprot:CAMPEP_0196739688 /NCGR_PEP_ID=MMETSP1091-20130531/24824_1 /TAXON_ID=302021 /ORGANISM="Rhodomonas sp., Strain CCMP768" /LENGTH=186 /DNA_ID=CAMNT_0042084371 /DNA_START=1 /DNA_END=561 /DNA_ORIENTATION=-
MQTPQTLGKRMLKDFLVPPGLSEHDNFTLAKRMATVSNAFVAATENAITDSSLPWPTEEEIAAAAERLKADQRTMVEVGEQIRTAARTLYEIQVKEDLLPRHWAGERDDEGGFRLVLAPNYIRLGMIEGALRACDSVSFLIGKAIEELNFDGMKERTVRKVCRRREANFIGEPNQVLGVTVHRRTT